MADDNSTNQLLLQALLEPLGVSLVMTADGAEATRAFQRDCLTWVLMDIQMPVMNGIEAAARIRQFERENGLSPTPIYALSANAMTHQIQAYIECGMDGHIAKPLDAGKLIATIHQVLIEPGEALQLAS